MLKQQYTDVIDLNMLLELRGYYESSDNYETVTMNKIAPGISVEKITPIVSELLKMDLVYMGGNFYKHTIPYLPHTDHRVEWGNTINVVVPIYYTESQPSLVVFDQQYLHDSVTWCLDGPLIEFSVNTGVTGRPADYDITDATNSDIDDMLYYRYLRHYGKYNFFGLSGEAFSFNPGNLIVFDNSLIHATSFFRGEKLGLSLRYRVL